MIKREADAVIDHVKQGGLVQISGAQVDSFAIVEESNGQWRITSFVWSPLALVDMPFAKLRFYKEVQLEVK